VASISKAPIIKKYNDKGQYNLDNPEEKKDDFLEEMIKNIKNLPKLY
jgi:hypothetical protein